MLSIGHIVFSGVYDRIYLPLAGSGGLVDIGGSGVVPLDIVELCLLKAAAAAVAFSVPGGAGCDGWFGSGVADNLAIGVLTPSALMVEGV